MGKTASPVLDPGIKEKVVVEIEEVEKIHEGVVEVGEGQTGFSVEGGDRGSAGGAADITLAIQVRITSRYDRLRLLVGPHRFLLLTEGGQKIPPCSSREKEPLLSESYLKGGNSKVGWLIFQVPPGEKKLTLLTDLRRPPLRIPVPERGR